MFSHPVDSRLLIHLPAQLKYAVLVVLLASLMVSLFLAMRFIGRPGGTDIVIIALTGTQFAATALAAVVVLFFSQTDATIRTLDLRTAEFLNDHLPRALARITIPGMAAGALTAAIGARDLFGAGYELRDGAQVRLRLWCGVNVRRLIVIYFVRCPPGPDRADAIERLRAVFRFTFGGAESVGYKLAFEPMSQTGDIVSIWATARLEDGFLTDPSAKLFWSQDIAMMTQSFLRTALRHDDVVAFPADAVPAPL